MENNNISLLTGKPYYESNNALKCMNLARKIDNILRSNTDGISVSEIIRDVNIQLGVENCKHELLTPVYIKDAVNKRVTNLFQHDVLILENKQINGHLFYIYKLKSTPEIATQTEVQENQSLSSQINENQMSTQSSPTKHNRAPVIGQEEKVNRVKNYLEDLFVHITSGLPIHFSELEHKHKVTWCDGAASTKSILIKRLKIIERANATGSTYAYTEKYRTKYISNDALLLKDMLREITNWKKNREKAKEKILVKAAKKSAKIKSKSKKVSKLQTEIDFGDTMNVVSNPIKVITLDKNKFFKEETVVPELKAERKYFVDDHGFELTESNVEFLKELLLNPVIANRLSTEGKAEAAQILTTLNKANHITSTSVANDAVNISRTNDAYDVNAPWAEKISFFIRQAGSPLNIRELVTYLLHYEPSYDKLLANSRIRVALSPSNNGDKHFFVDKSTRPARYGLK